ncbi:MAG: hypothetical protein QXO99_08420 [Candidatus Methanomethylicia archaeon]
MATLKYKVIYHRRNNEVITDSDEGRRIQELLKPENIVKTFLSGHNQYGHFENIIYAITGGLVIVSLWHPAVGYSWDEKIITFIKIPE